MGKGTGELGGLQLGSQQLLCYLPQSKELAVLSSPCGSTWEASGRKESPRLNALPSAVAREQEKQVGSVYFIHQRAKKWLRLKPRARGVQPLPGWSSDPNSPLPPSLPSRAKDLKTRLGALLHKPELGHKAGSSSKLQLSSRRR